VVTCDGMEMRKTEEVRFKNIVGLINPTEDKAKQYIM
jgi:hypothetical protein